MLCNPVNFFKCLSDETRLKIILLLSHNGKLYVCNLHETLDQPQSKISRHLAELRRHELLLGERSGKWVHYQLNPDLPRWMMNVITQTSNACHDEYTELFSKKHTLPCESNNERK